MAGGRTWWYIRGCVCPFATVPVTYGVCVVCYEHKAKLMKNQKTNLKKGGEQNKNKQTNKTHTHTLQNNETCSGKQREGNN